MQIGDNDYQPTHTHMHVNAGKRNAMEYQQTDRRSKRWVRDLQLLEFIL